jgi:hypothetical protein
MGDVRTYRYPGRTPHYLKNGEARYSKNVTTKTYCCKLHHPDAAEMAAIRAELAAGASKKDVAARHRLGATPQRLNRLLARAPPPAAVTPALSDAELDALLADAGWL